MLNLYEEKCLWTHLAQTKKPVVMYGMGDGAVKILNVMKEKNIIPAEFMASDEFVRGHSFQGYVVKKLSEIEEKYRDFIIIVCFGSALPDVMDKLFTLSAKYELYAPDVPVIGGGLFDENFIEENAEKLNKAYNLLADEESREVFQKWLNYRISGKINYLSMCETGKDEAYSLLNLGENETYIDLGAYNGDTVEEFLHYTNNCYDKIYALEPDTRNYGKLKRKHYALNPVTFRAINAGVWDKDCTLQFAQKGGRNSTISPFEVENASRKKEVEMRCVDKLLADGEKATLIKFDVEGSEKQAINGCRETILRDKPKMIVSLYHRNEDMFELLLQIYNINHRYKFYLRHHPYIPAWDTNLYCV